MCFSGGVPLDPVYGDSVLLKLYTGVVCVVNIALSPRGELRTGRLECCEVVASHSPHVSMASELFLAEPCVHASDRSISARMLRNEAPVR